MGGTDAGRAGDGAVSVAFGTVRTFKRPMDARAEAKHLVQEAAEVFSAYEDWESTRDPELVPHFMEEAADLAQNLANLVDCVTGNPNGTDMTGYIQRVYRKNESRGWEYQE